ncbi:MAG TPA: hypothetical protein VE689_07005, partial [Candidatus Udaeobacter sp.]|nr:hypothetical protein [Candidatus Udaeobacter sp.]
ESPTFLGKLKQLFAAQIFFSELDGFNAAIQRLFQDPKQIAALCLAPVSDQAKIEIGRGHVRC